eukprot:c7217_g1_i1.p1 GENE.c7217_g1_i1~~c7217_g1_i1.p1  ORF type:complete len:449 (-),score=194.00 c7217_g1_i1:36-1382(-)
MTAEVDNVPLWTRILQDVSKIQSSKQNKTLLILGDRQSGKSTLLSRLEESEDESNGLVLEYNFISVKDPINFTDEPQQLDVWTYDGDPNHLQMLEHVINADTIEQLAVAIVVDFARPWTIESSTKFWLDAVGECTNTVWNGLSDQEAKAGKDKIRKYLNRYRVTNGFKADAKVQQKEEDENDEKEEIEIPLEEGVLEKNYGIPIFLVATRSDILYSPDYAREYSLKSEHYDLVQQTLRTIAIEYGASLLFTAALSNRTQAQVLSDYIGHRLFGFPLTHDAEDVNRENIFIPSGWDSFAKIKGLFSKETKISDVFTPPSKAVEGERQLIPTPVFSEFLLEEKKRIETQPKANVQMDEMRKGVHQMMYNKPETQPIKQPEAGASPNKAGAAGGKPDAAANFFKNILAGSRGAPGAVPGAGPSVGVGAVGAPPIGIQPPPAVAKRMQEQGK